MKKNLDPVVNPTVKPRGDDLLWDDALEKGQSLVEFVILVPLFFLVISGINLYLNQEIKSLTENSSYDALLIADSHFDSEERILAHWNAAKMDTTKYNTSILNNSFNSSAYFSQSVDMSHDVFMDKQKVTEGSQNICGRTPVYQLHSARKSEFKFESCANGNGFENSGFSYKNILEDFKPTTRKQEGKSIYYPSETFSWPKRHLMAANAVKAFQFNPQNQAFSTYYASLSLPKDNAQFNAECLMNPQTSNCALPPFSGKWRRAAFDGANTQVLECLAEASVKCLKLIAPPAVAGCMVERTAEIATSLALGQKAAVCPILNRITETIYNEVLFTAKGYQLETAMQETLQRESILSFF